MRWRKILISSNALIDSSGTFRGFLRMARWNNGCAVGNWAERIDYNHTCKPLCYEVTIP